MKNKIIDKVNELDNMAQKVQSPLNFSFNRQKYVDDVKNHKKIFIYAVSRSIVDKIIERLDINAEIVRNVEDADFVIAHKNFAKGGTKVLAVAMNTDCLFILCVQILCRKFKKS